MSKLIRPALQSLEPVIHGARDYAELARLGIAPENVIDFSNNSNPYGPHPAVLKAVQTAVTGPALARYPDRSCLELVRAIATAEGVSTDCILPTNGASELIQLIALAVVTPGSKHLILTPTFGEYSRAIQLMEGLSHEYRSTGEDFRIDVEAVATAIHDLQPDGIWLCNPNNPTGQQLTVEEIAYLRTAALAYDPVWVVDESYRYFAANTAQWLTAGDQGLENTILIRSLTKEHALAGLRLGYAIARPAFIKALRLVQPPWSVNSLAQVAGIAALQPEVVAWRAQSLSRLRKHATNLWGNLSNAGLNVLPSATTYALIEVGDAPAFRHALLTQGVLVRDCTSFGLPQHVRIAARRPPENERLRVAIKNQK